MPVEMKDLINRYDEIKERLRAVVTREGGKVVLTDGAGAKATVSKADERYSNGVVHRISGVLMPQQGAAAAAPAQAQ